jgi:squalene cyclase
MLAKQSARNPAPAGCRRVSLPLRGGRSPGSGWTSWLAAGLVAGQLAAADVASLAPPSASELERAIARGVQFLIQTQNKDGSWGSARRTKDLNIFAPVPGAHQAFRAAVTALCIEALLETGLCSSNAAAQTALDRATSWLLMHLPEVRRADGVAIYNVWTHAYGIQTLAKLAAQAQSDPARWQQITNLIADQIDRLRRYESVDGGWGYYDFRVQSKRPATDSTSFLTATVLIALDEARKIGVAIPAELTDRAIQSLHRQRKPDFSYLYGEYLKWQPMRPVNRPAGSLGRSQACNLALRLWGDTNVTVAVLTNWLDRLLARNEWLSFARKRPVPHESYFEVAGYFFYYGHYYAVLVTEHLPPSTGQGYRDRLAAVLLPLQEKDGAWWDYPLYDYHQAYGTAYALTALARCRPGRSNSARPSS